MNTSNPDPKQVAEAFDEREWRAQEQALRDERLGLAAAGSDAPLAHYRLVARALREPPAHSLPPDFARQVADKVEARSPPARAKASFEQIMLASLGATLAVSGAVALVKYGGEALAAFDARSLQWGLAIVACVGLTWAFDGLRRLRHHGESLRPA